MNETTKYFPDSGVLSGAVAWAGMATGPMSRKGRGMVVRRFVVSIQRQLGTKGAAEMLASRLADPLPSWVKFTHAGKPNRTFRKAAKMACRSRHAAGCAYEVRRQSYVPAVFGLRKNPVTGKLGPKFPAFVSKKR